MQYLSFDCFAHDLTDSQLQDFGESGAYAFCEYALLHWSDHLLAIVESLKKEELSNQSLFGIALNSFYEVADPRPLEKNDCYDDLSNKCTALVGSDCHETLLVLLCRNTALRREYDQIDGLGHHGKLLHRIRCYLAGSLVSSTQEHQSVVLYYGENMFKCPWHACYYFHEGFRTAKELSQHIDRHKRPWCCTEIGCLRELIGFPTEKEFKKHMSQTHPDPESLSFKFPHVKKLPTTFRCDTCSKQFARQSVLTTHISRVHLKEKKHGCQICKKAFATKSDRDRHGLVHQSSRSPRSSQEIDSPAIS